MLDRRYHKVSQNCGLEGICVAVNYWFVHCPASPSKKIRTDVNAHRSDRYDMDFGGFHYASSAFIRDVALAAAVNVKGKRL